MKEIILHKAPSGAEQITRGTERFNIVMKEYPTEYLVSSKRAKKYWKEKERQKFPMYIEKGLKTGLYELRFKTPHAGKCVYNLVSKEFVVKNPRVQGTEKKAPINSQVLWASGEGGQYQRLKIKECLGAYFKPRIIQQLPEGIWAPLERYIQLEFLFYIQPAVFRSESEIPDIDNHSYFYVKCFIDALKELEVIKGDDPRYVRGYSSRYVYIAPADEQRMEVKFHFCGNEEPMLPKIFTVDNPVLNSYAGGDIV